MVGRGASGARHAAVGGAAGRRRPCHGSALPAPAQPEPSAASTYTALQGKDKDFQPGITALLLVAKAVRRPAAGGLGGVSMLSGAGRRQLRQRAADGTHFSPQRRRP